MPAREHHILSITKEYLDYLEDLGLSPASLPSYRWVLNTSMRSLAAAGMTYDPKMIGPLEIQHLRTVTWGHFKPKSAKQSLSIMRGLMEHHGNTVMASMRFVWPQDTRTNVDWLTPEQAMELESKAIGRERLLVHLELRLGLRRIEVIRLTLDDLDIPNRRIHVRGKGRGGGKWRSIPFHYRTEEVLSEWMELRQELVRKARAKDPSAEEPRELLIYRHMGRVSGYKRTGLDNITRTLSRRSGIKFAHHTLRRTFGRMHWLAGTRLETLSAMMGHSDTVQTLQYIGVQVDDMADAMKGMREFEQNLR